MYGEGGFLRVLVPRTENGINPLQDENGTNIYKEVHLPLSAQAAMESVNKKLPAYLRRKLEVVTPPPPAPKKEETPAPPAATANPAPAAAPVAAATTAPAATATTPAKEKTA